MSQLAVGVLGASLCFTGLDAESLRVGSSQIVGNQAENTTAGGFASSGGAHLELAGTARARIVDSLIAVNQASGVERSSKRTGVAMKGGSD